MTITFDTKYNLTQITDPQDPALQRIVVVDKHGEIVADCGQNIVNASEVLRALTLLDLLKAAL